jgi:hypothetical protein
MPDEKPALLPENLVNEDEGKSRGLLSAHAAPQIIRSSAVTHSPFPRPTSCRMPTMFGSARVYRSDGNWAAVPASKG